MIVYPVTHNMVGGFIGFAFAFDYQNFANSASLSLILKSERRISSEHFTNANIKALFSKAMDIQIFVYLCGHRY